MSTAFHVRRQAERALILATSRTGKLGGWSREARDPRALRAALESLARNTLLVCDALDECEPHESWTPEEGDRGFHCSDDACHLSPHYVKSDDGAYRFRGSRWVLPGRVG